MYVLGCSFCFCTCLGFILVDVLGVYKGLASLCIRGCLSIRG